MISEATSAKIKQHLSTAKRFTWATFKYGAVFGSGVLVGTICGVVLFFKIAEDDV